jgi:hypothetical protein
MKKFFAILTVAAFTGHSFAQTTPPGNPADKPASTEKKKKKKKTTDTTAPASTDKSAPKKQ